MKSAPTKLRWLRYAARTVALLCAGWWTLFGVLAGIGEELDAVGVFMHTAVPGLLFLVATLIAWRWELLGVGLLALEGLLVMVVFGFARTPEGFLLLALPPLLAAVLFLADWLETRQAPTIRGST